MLTPSGVPCPRVSKLDPDYRVRIMDESDIALVIEQFAHSAAREAERAAIGIRVQAEAEKQAAAALAADEGLMLLAETGASACISRTTATQAASVRPTSSASDCSGNSVAAPNAAANSPT